MNTPAEKDEGFEEFKEFEPDTALDLPSDRPECESEIHLKVMVVRGKEEIEVIDYTKGGNDTIEFKTLDDALVQLNISQAEDVRQKIHLLISRFTKDHDDELSFLLSIRSINKPPYVAIARDKAEKTRLVKVSNKLVPECMTDKEIILTVQPEVKKYWEKKEVQERPYEASKHSPLPAVGIWDKPANDNHDLSSLESREEGMHWVALLDFDNTLYEADSRHSIMLHQFAKYLKKNHAADFENNMAALEELIEYCNIWEEQRKMVSQKRPTKAILEKLKLPQLIEYDEGIITSGTKSAAAFEGMDLNKLKEYGEKFVNESMGGKIFDYVAPVIQELRDYGISPVITTGLPDFLVPAILKKLGLEHGKGMTYEEKDGKFEGFVKVNLGIATEKARYGDKLRKKGYAIAFSMGDSRGDMGLHSCSVGRGKPKHDVHGGAVIVNASKETEEEVKRSYTVEIDGGFVRIVEPSKHSDDVVAAVTLTLRKIFEPSNKYLETRDIGSSEALHEYCEKLKRILKERENEKDKKEGKKCEETEEEKKRREEDEQFLWGLENIKRIRDVLRKREGLSERETTAQLRKFYPAIIVEYVMKPHNLDTRDESAIAQLVEDHPNLVDLRNPQDTITKLEKIGCSRETIANVLNQAREHNDKHSYKMPEIRRRSSAPPPPPPAQRKLAS